LREWLAKHVIPDLALIPENATPAEKLARFSSEKAKAFRDAFSTYNAKSAWLVSRVRGTLYRSIASDNLGTWMNALEYWRHRND